LSKRENWIDGGLIAGKTNTIYPWQVSWGVMKNKRLSLIGRSKPAGAEPEIWFHDLFRKDETPHDETKIAFFKKCIAEGNNP